MWASVGRGRIAEWNNQYYDAVRYEAAHALTDELNGNIVEAT